MNREGQLDPKGLLSAYYKYLFPYGLYYRWLNYGGVANDYFSRREFSFMLPDGNYMRYLSFSGAKEFEEYVQDKQPHKIDLGAVYKVKLPGRKAVAKGEFQAQERELVFDIDLSDYDDVRHCCKETAICPKCWPLMQMAARVIDTALKEDYGFRHRLWVFSGRRGVHCWVCDASARALEPKARTAVSRYLTVAYGEKKVPLRSRDHPSVERAISLIRPSFERYACGLQDFLGVGAKMEKVAALVPLASVRQQLAVDFLRGESSPRRWHILQTRLRMEAGKQASSKLARCADEIMLLYCYPRLDLGVTRCMGHLLKAPFSVHPHSGRVCLPFDIAAIDSFDPFQVPRFDQLVEELNMPRSTGAKKGVEILRTGMAVFERFLGQLDESAKQPRATAAPMDSSRRE